MITNLCRTTILVSGIVVGTFGSSVLRVDWPIGQKVRGVCYQPIPENAVGQPNTPWFESSDVCTEQFSALYGDGNVAGVRVTIGNARHDVDEMQQASFNVIRMYDWNGQATGAAKSNCDWNQQGPIPPEGGNGHLRFLDYCHAHGIKVIVPISNYVVKAFPEDTYGNTWQNLTDGIINSCKLSDTTLHPAVHSFSVGNETDIPASSDSPSNNNQGLDRACQIVNRVLDNPAVVQAGVMATIPISNRRNGQYPNQDESPFDLMEMMRDGGTHTVSGVTSTIANANRIVRYEKFYNSLQAFQQNDEYVEQILDPYDDRFASSTHQPKLIFTEWGYPKFVSGVCTEWQKRPLPQTDQDQADLLVAAMRDTWDYFTDNPDTLFRGICVFQWQDSRSASAEGCNTTFGLHKYADGSKGRAEFDCYFCGGACWTPGSYDIDPLREIRTTEGTLITEAIEEIWDPQMLGDIDENGIVDEKDLLLLMSELGYEQHDTDFDRDIDGVDLGRLLESWGPYGEDKP